MGSPISNSGRKEIESPKEGQHPSEEAPKVGQDSSGRKIIHVIGARADEFTKRIDCFKKLAANLPPEIARNRWGTTLKKNPPKGEVE